MFFCKLLHAAQCSDPHSVVGEATEGPHSGSEVGEVVELNVRVVEEEGSVVER